MKKTLLIILLLLLGCKAEQALQNVQGTIPVITDPTPTPTPTPTSTPDQCSSQVIDSGIKGSVTTTTTRGSFSDIKFITGTTRYATAYYDNSALSLKISYWNGSSFTHEVVSGDTGATFVRLEFLSTGIPLVFWANGGTSVKMAARSVAFGSSGTWSTAIIDNVAGAASRALETSVSPNNEVAIVYLTNTTNAGKPRFVYCSSNCHNYANYATMSATENIETTGALTLITAQMSTGVAWCGVDTNADSAVDDYYPAVVYTAGTNQSRYAVCAQSNLANCLTNTNWTKTNFSSTTSNIASKLLIDPAVVNDIPKIASLKAATGIRTYEGNTGCSSVAAFTESNQTIGGTTSGNAWLEVLETADGRFHLFANETTTSFRYYNTTGTNFISSVASPTQWNTAGTVMTTTLLAAGATFGGAAVDTVNNKVLSTFYQGALSFNLVLAEVNDHTAASSAATFNNFYPNTKGAIQANATPLRNISTAATSAGKPAVAYVDYSAGALTTGRLKYAFRNSTSVSGTWSTVLVPFTGASPAFPALKFDHNDLPWISYFDSNAANSKFYLMTNSSSDGSGTWVTYQFPIASLTGAHTLPAANDTALAMYYSSGVAYPVMIVIDNNNTSQGVKSAKLNPSTGVWSSVVTIDALGASDGAWLSADNDESGNIVVGYQDLTAPIGVDYAYSSDAGATWTTPKRIHGTIGPGQAVSMKINPSTSRPSASFYDRAGNTVLYSSCAESLSNCASTGWSTVDIETAAGVSTSYTTATFDQYLATSLIFDADGLPRIFYPIGMGSTIGATEAGHLKKVVFDSDANQTKSTYMSGVGASATTSMNLGVTGHNVSSVFTSEEEEVSAFISSGNYLVVKACNFSN